MDQDDSAGFGSYMPFRFPAFSASTAVDFSDNTMDMSILPLEHRAFHTPSSYNSDTALDFSTDESVSPSSHTSSSMFDMTDPPIVPDMNGYDPMYFDGRSLPLLNTILPGAPVTSSSISDLDYLDDNSHVIPSHDDLSAHGTSFVNSRPPTRTSFHISPRSGQNIPDFTNPSMDDMIEESVTSSPTSSSSQSGDRDHEYYRRGMDPIDGLYHCPMEVDGCDFAPKALKCEYHKHIDSHLKPFRCRKPGCANQAFSSVACRLRHEREMHKMHNAEEFLCRYTGPCERKQSGNGFARSFNRGDHEKRVHHIVQENPRKGRPKNVSNDSSHTHSSHRKNSALRKQIHRDNSSPSGESSTSTIGATVSTHFGSVDGPLAAAPMDSYARFPDFQGGANFGNPPNTTLSFMPNQVIPSSPFTTRTRPSKASVKPNMSDASQTSKKRQEYERQWPRRVRMLRNLASRLPDIPDGPSHNLVYSIQQEAQVLLQLSDDGIDLWTIENSRTR